VHNCPSPRAVGYWTKGKYREDEGLGESDQTTRRLKGNGGRRAGCDRSLMLYRLLLQQLRPTPARRRAHRSLVRRNHTSCARSGAPPRHRSASTSRASSPPARRTGTDRCTIHASARGRRPCDRLTAPATNAADRTRRSSAWHSAERRSPFARQACHCSNRDHSGRARPRTRQEGTLLRVADDFDRGASEITEQSADDDAVALRRSTRSAHRRTPSPPPSTAWDSREWSCRRSAASATRRGSTTEKGTVFT
jgi:hypothetical protein